MFGSKDLGKLWLAFFFISSSSFGQSKRMVVDGNLRLEGGSIPSTTLIRVLRSDSSIAKSISLYDPSNGKFGVRLTDGDGFDDEERVLFRVVISPRDSFLARLTPGVFFRGAELPAQAPTVKVDIFRNHIPLWRRVLPDTTISEGQSLRYRMSAYDLDGDTVLYSIAKAPSGSGIDRINGLFSWTPTYDQAGLHEAIFTVGDVHSTDASRTILLTVKNANRLAYFKTLPHDTTILEAQRLTYSLSGDDPDGDSVHFSSNRLPGGAVLDSLRGRLEWIPGYDHAGTHQMMVSVLDKDHAGVMAVFKISVMNVNRAPRFTAALLDTAIEEGQELRFHYAGKDPDGDTVEFQLASGPTGATVSTNGLLQWRPTFSQSGYQTLEIAIRDDSLRTFMSTNIYVMNVNHMPSLAQLMQPAETDTVATNSARPIVFVWTKSHDEDSDDTLRYNLRIKGESLDTTVTGIRDTMVALNLRTRFQAGSVYSSMISVSDGWVLLATPTLFSFRTSPALPPRETGVAAPRAFSLEHNFPNPFNPTTAVRFGIPERSYVKLTVWNMLGEQVQVLVSEEKESGIYESMFRAENLPSGVYLVKLEAHPVMGTDRKDFISTKKMILVK